MPGSSLWLVPPSSSVLSATLSTLIETTIPRLFPIALSLRFSPHVTLTADTAPDPENPQRWLDGLELPESSVKELQIEILEPQVGEMFFRKLTLRVEKNRALGELAGVCRMAGTGEERSDVERWVEGVCAPHASLMYSHLPSEDVKAKMQDVHAVIRCARESSDAASSLMSEGAEIWLVPTFEDVQEWKPVARRTIDGVKWKWEG